MRIVGGEWRGRRLMAPPGRATRPTSDKVREAVFDLLASLLAQRAADHGQGSGVEGLAGLRVADLYAGSGALGLEALSRGAAHCTFVERSPVAAAALRRNLGALAVPAERARLVVADAGPALQADARRGVQYTLLFADPPYARYEAVQRALRAALAPVLAPRAVVVVETAKGEAVELALSVERVRVYGDTQITILVNRAEGGGSGEAPCRTE